MRLQRRLYGIYFVCFLTFMTPCSCKLVSFFVKFLNRPYIYLFKAVNLIWRGNRHILRVLGRLHSIKFCGYPCISVVSEICHQNVQKYTVLNIKNDSSESTVRNAFIITRDMNLFQKLKFIQNL